MMFSPVTIRPRHVLLASLALMGLNYALTSRWADVAGSIHGPKEPVFLAVWLATVLATVWKPRSILPTGPRIAGAVAVGGLLVLTSGVLVWFPPSTWTERPFLDNWPARFQSTMDGIALYRQGVASGWEWHFLGGYHTSSDLTVTVSALALVPVLLLGPEVGFHALHAGLLLALPALVFVDLRTDGDDPISARLAVGLVALTVTGWFSYYLVRSGDTNSLAGTVCTLAALVGSHAAARGHRWGGVLLVLALVLVNYSHAGFFVYSVVLLGVECLFYRDWRRARRAAVGIAAAMVAALPVTWESWRYPAYFTFNNVTLDPPPFAIEPFLRKVYYNVEILFLPGRWFNDFTGLALVCLPIILWTAWKTRHRLACHAWMAVAAIALLRLNTPEFGYAFLRPVHLLAVFPSVALAGFLTQQIRDRRLVVLVSVLAAVYLQYLWMPVPHVRTARDLDPVLVDELQPLDGALVLLENTFHRDMDADPESQTEPTPFDAHLEGYLAEVTGRRFYAGLWDGWQWSPFRAQLLSGGAFKGRRLDAVKRDEVRAELRKWGIRHLLVWSRAATAYFSADPAFARRWQHERWTRYEFLDADPRSVITAAGDGHLVNLHPLGASVLLDNVRADDVVVVRTNYYPAWSAVCEGQAIDVFDVEGQLAFRVPRDGRLRVDLVYPRRLWLTALAFGAVVAGLLLVVRMSARVEPVGAQVGRVEGAPPSVPA